MSKAGESGHFVWLCQFKRGGCHDVVDIYKCGNSEDLVLQVQMVGDAYPRVIGTSRGKARATSVSARKLHPSLACTENRRPHGLPRPFGLRESGGRGGANSMKQRRNASEERHLARRSEKKTRGACVRVRLRSPCLACALPSLNCF